MKNRIQM